MNKKLNISDDLIINKIPRYERRGKCNRCGWCCLQEDPPCPYLKKEIDGRYTCTIFNEKERHVRCILYPDGPPIIHKDCGYWFIDTWENNKIVKGKV